MDYWQKISPGTQWLIGIIVTILAIAVSFAIYFLQRKKPKGPHLDLPDFSDASEKANAFGDPQEADIFSLLRHTIRFGEVLHGRGEGLEAIGEWANAPSRMASGLIAAPGGAGKTRLALEALHALKKSGWITGFVPGGFAPEKDLPAKRFRRNGRLFLVMDYPEERDEENLRAVLAGVWDWQRKTGWKARILLLSRDHERERWEDMLRNALPDDDPLSLRLPPLAALRTEEALALARDVHESLRDISPFQALDDDWEPDFSQWLEQDVRRRLPLFVIAAMLEEMLKKGEEEEKQKKNAGQGETAFDRTSLQVLAGLARRELKRAKKASRKIGLDESTLPRLLALATLSEGLTKDGIRALSGQPGLCNLDENAIARTPWWDGKEARLAPLQPDRPAAAFIAQALLNGDHHDPEALPQWLSIALQGRESAFCARLPRFIYDIGEINRTSADNLLRALSKIIEVDPARSTVFANIAERESHLAAPFAIVVAHALVKKAKDEKIQAIRLNNLANILFTIGRREEALDAAQRAVKLLRILADQNAEIFEPSLAMSLATLANCFSGIGRREEAVKAAQEATDIRRKLAGRNAEAFEPDLASSLNNLANFLSDIGLREEALALAKEATNLYYKLADHTPEDFEPYLAGSLSNLPKFLSELGRRKEALEMAKKATNLFRKLAANEPEAFTPDLASSLNNLAISFSSLGQQENALKVAQQAADIRRELADRNAETFEPDLATSLANLANRLSIVGKHEKALKVAQKAADIRRKLASRNAEAFNPDLVKSLGSLGVMKLKAGMADQAQTHYAEGLRILTPHLQRLPQAFTPLAKTLASFYMQACEKNGNEPDMDIIGPVEEILEFIPILKDDE